MSKQCRVGTFFDKCMYKDCANIKSDGKRLYRFPLQTDERFHLWIHNSGNTKLEKWSPNTIRRAGLCEDHFHQDLFSDNSKKRLKRNAVPIPHTSVIDISHKYDVQMNKNRKRQLKQVPHFEETNAEQIEFIEENATSSASVSINNNVIIDEQPLVLQHPSRCYQPSHLSFGTSMEEDGMKWLDIEPPKRVSISEPERVPVSTPERVPTPLPIKKKKPENEENNTTIQNLYTEINSLKAENIKLRSQVNRLKYRLRCIPLKRKTPKNNKQKKKILQKMIDGQDLHPVAKAMIKLQLHTPKAKYTEEEKNLSRQLYYYSAAAFCRLRKAGCNFPGQRTLQRWLEEYDIRPGFCDIIFKKLKEKFSHLPKEERVCVLKWDEMAIKANEEYSLKLDEIEGLVDLGPLRRKSERARCVFVFCLDSLNAHHAWRQPLAYFLPGKCMKAEEIIILLKECLDRLSETGADVQLVTCDQGTCNQSAYAQLGINPDNPFFIHNEKKYYASFDFPHLIKRLLAFFRTHNNLYCDGQIIASYSDFVATWSVDNATKGGSNLLSHITEAHIRPNNFESMNVKRAFQILSHTYAAAIKTAGHEKQLSSITWQATAEFAERLNNVIDACNAYSIKISFGGKRPLSSKNPDIENLLIDFVKWCSKWSKSATSVSQIPCFRGFVLTGKAILETYKKLSTEYDGFELATGLCNQDSVEHLFSRLRQRGGFNPNPTARMIRLSIRHILSTGYIQTSDKGNTQCPESETLINEPSQLIKSIENVMSNGVIEYDELESELLLENENILLNEFDIEEIENINSLGSSYDENAIAFFAGFVARRSIEKSNCDYCRNDMMKTPMDESTANEKYIEFREYENEDEDAPAVTKLVRPTALYTNITKTQLMAFNRTWQYHWASTKVLNKIVSECMHATNKTHPGWLDTNNKCYDHRMQALKYMIRVKIYSRTRYNNRAAKRTNIPSNKKVKRFLSK